MAERTDVVFVDGVRTPFGRAGEKGMYWNTRADDLVVKAIIGLLERNPSVPKDRIDEVAIAATTQRGDQGLTLGRTAALLAGLPKSVPGFAIDRMCAGAMTSVPASASVRTTSPSPAASSTWGTTRWGWTPIRTRASSPSGWSAPTPSTWATRLSACTTASRTS